MLTKSLVYIFRDSTIDGIVNDTIHQKFPSSVCLLFCFLPHLTTSDEARFIILWGFMPSPAVPWIQLLKVQQNPSVLSALSFLGDIITITSKTIVCFGHCHIWKKHLLPLCTLKVFQENCHNENTAMACLEL